MRKFNIEQGTKEWHELRAGKFTGSDIVKLFSGKTTKGYQNLLFKKAGELITKLSDDDEETTIKEMLWGKEHEAEAKEYYSIAFDEQLENVGFICPDDSDDYGCSPDSLLNRPKGAEFKCPKTLAAHVWYLNIKSQEQLKKDFPQYYWQIQMCLKVTGFDSWDFVSYHPYFTGAMRMVALEIKPNEADQLLLTKELNDAITLRDKYILIAKS